MTSDAIDGVRDIHLRGFTTGAGGSSPVRPLIVITVEGRGKPTASQITVGFAVTTVSGSGSVLVLRLACEPLQIRYQVPSLEVAAQTGSQTLGVLSRFCCYVERSGRTKNTRNGVASSLNFSRSLHKHPER